MLLHWFESNPTHYPRYRYISNMKFTIINVNYECHSIVPALICTCACLVLSHRNSSTKEKRCIQKDSENPSTNVRMCIHSVDCCSICSTISIDHVLPRQSQSYTFGTESVSHPYQMIPTFVHFLEQV